MASIRRERTTRRGFTASLRCGNVLTYEAMTFVPNVGETVPCHRHGYCAVISRELTGRREPRVVSRRAGPPSQQELLAILHRRPVTTVHALREHRFTLRIIAEAERDGLVDTDLLAGRVVLRAHSAERVKTPGVGDVEVLDS